MCSLQCSLYEVNKGEQTCVVLDSQVTPTSFPASLILRPLGRARRHPGLVWSRVTMTVENIREGSSVIRQFVALSFVALWPPLPAMFNGSLWAESSNSTYSTVYVKDRQVCLETIYRGRDVVAVIPIGFMESRSYLNCGCRAAHDSY